MPIGQNKYPTHADYVPGPFDWHTLVVLAPASNKFTTGRELQLRDSLEGWPEAHASVIEEDDKSDNLLIKFFIEGFSRPEALTRAVGAIFISLVEGSPDESNFVAMQLAEELEVEAEGPEILTDKAHDVSEEANILLNGLLKDQDLIRHLKAS
jgi:hypothetical protein